MNLKKFLCGAAVCCLLTGNACAATIPADVFTQKATSAGLKVRNYKNTDIMGNENSGIYVKYAPKKLYGSTGYAIYCYDNTDKGELYLAIGLDPRNKLAPVPKTVVINDNGKRIDIPVPTYKREDGYASLFGNWSEYQMSIPLTMLKYAGVRTIKGISVLMVNPESGVESNDFEAILTAKQDKAIIETNNIYNFYLQLSGAQP